MEKCIICLESRISFLEEKMGELIEVIDMLVDEIDEINDLFIEDVYIEDDIYTEGNLFCKFKNIEFGRNEK